MLTLPLKVIPDKCNDEPLVSVVIPIYNVELYLKKCILSVMVQTYTNIEIILVDDGSTDGSAKICASLADKDQRINVIHKQNGGLSDARNVGIDESLGKYLTFVDSDDYISSKMIEVLVNSILINECDIATCNIVKYHEESQSISKTKQYNNSQVLQAVDALENMLYQKSITNSACAKLYKSTLFNNIRYPVGKTYEDLGTTYKLFSKANYVVLNSYCGYSYMQRKDSITRSKFSKNRMSGIEFAEEQLRFVEKNHPDIAKAAKDRLFTEARYTISVINDDSELSLKSLDRCKTIIKSYRRNVILDRKSNIVNRLFAAISYFSINIMIAIIVIKAKRDSL